MCIPKSNQDPDPKKTSKPNFGRDSGLIKTSVSVSVSGSRMVLVVYSTTIARIQRKIQIKNVSNAFWQPYSVISQVRRTEQYVNYIIPLFVYPYSTSWTNNYDSPLLLLQRGHSAHTIASLRMDPKLSGL
jgi:hypothetical protein